MPIFLNALICAIVGAVAAHVAYVQSNLFIQQGDPIRRGYHPLFDPLAFDLMGMFWGLVAGAVCALWFREAGAGRAVLLGLGVTLAGIGVVGGGVTAQRYVAMPRVPTIDGKDLWLEFELRLPRGHAGAGELPQRGELRTHGQGTDIVSAFLQPDKTQTHDGRITITGAAELRRSARDRQLDVFDGNVPWPSFMLALPGSPTKADMEWSNWYPVDGSKDADAVRWARGYQIRYRVILESD